VYVNLDLRDFPDAIVFAEFIIMHALGYGAFLRNLSGLGIDGVSVM
jgi:hypothetical protein